MSILIKNYDSPIALNLGCIAVGSGSLSSGCKEGELSSMILFSSSVFGQISFLSLLSWADKQKRCLIVHPRAPQIHPQLVRVVVCRQMVVERLLIPQTLRVLPTISGYADDIF